MTNIIEFIENNTNAVLVESTETHNLYHYDMPKCDYLCAKRITIYTEKNKWRFNKMTITLADYKYKENVEDAWFMSYLTKLSQTYHISNLHFWTDQTLYRLLKKEVLTPIKPKQEVYYTPSSMKSDYWDNFQPTRWENERDEDTGRVTGGSFKPY